MVFEWKSIEMNQLGVLETFREMGCGGAVGRGKGDF